jgi:hypothetical protein
MKKYKVVIDAIYMINAKDQDDALDKAEDHLAEELSGTCAFKDVFVFKAEEIE